VIVYKIEGKKQTRRKRKERADLTLNVQHLTQLAVSSI
jgi:hypothetical protein